MTDAQRRQLKRANLLAAGHILRAKAATTQQQMRAHLIDALMTYALITPA